jgi:hypothetical protein
MLASKTAATTIFFFITGNLEAEVTKILNIQEYLLMSGGSYLIKVKRLYQALITSFRFWFLFLRSNPPSRTDFKLAR